MIDYHHIFSKGALHRQKFPLLGRGSPGTILLMPRRQVNSPFSRNHRTGTSRAGR